MVKEERDIVSKLRVFARFQSPEEHEALVDGILKARKLKLQIELYKLYRQMGLRTLDQVKEYETAKKNKERDLKMKKQQAHFVLENIYSKSSSVSYDSDGFETIPTRKSSSNQLLNLGDSPDNKGRRRSRGANNATEAETEETGVSRCLHLPYITTLYACTINIHLYAHSCD